MNEHQQIQLDKNFSQLLAISSHTFSPDEINEVLESNSKQNVEFINSIPNLSLSGNENRENNFDTENLYKGDFEKLQIQTKLNGVF